MSSASMLEREPVGFGSQSLRLAPPSAAFLALGWRCCS